MRKMVEPLPGLAASKHTKMRLSALNLQNPNKPHTKEAHTAKRKQGGFFMPFQGGERLMRGESRASKSRRMPRKRLVRGETSSLSNFKTGQMESASSAHGDAPLFCALLPQSPESASHAREGNFFPVRIPNGKGGKRPCVRENLPASTNLRPHCRKYLGAGKPGGTV